MPIADARTREDGFTLIELLVVIAIIGVLAAIALPAFLQQQGKAQDLEAKTAARTAQIVMETFFSSSGHYGCDTACVRSMEPTLSSGVAATGLAVTPGLKEYSITMTQDKTGSVFRIVHAADGTVVRTCDDPGSDGCPADGVW